jgi:predicted secreted hydrolase
VNHEIAEVEPSRFHVKGDLLDLDLLSRKQPLLEGGEGYVALRDKGTYYYSLTDLDVAGALRVNGKCIEVEGRGWMDHQWADTPFSRDAWTWFCLQLDHGMDIMCVEYDDHVSKSSGADLIDRRGNAVHGQRVMFTPGDKVWKSPKTKAEYPLSWTIDIPEKRISLQVRALLEDQEMIYGTINYFECPIEVHGVVGRKRVKGVGYMEYPSDYSYLALVEKEFIAQIRKTLMAEWKRMAGRR